MGKSIHAHLCAMLAKAAGFNVLNFLPEPSPYQRQMIDRVTRREPIEHSATSTRKSAQRGRRRKRQARRERARATRR